MPAENPFIDATTELQAAVEQFVKNSKQTYEQMQKEALRRLKFVWANPQGYTPQEIVAAFGARGKKLFEAHGALIVALATVDPSIVAQVNAIKGTYTIDDTTGIVTITGMPPA
jgi:hypothetical protein